MTAAVSNSRLEKVPLLAQFSAGECQQLMEIARSEEFKPGEIVLAEGESSRNLWIVLDGTCEVVKESDQTGRLVVMSELEPFAHFGEMSFFHAAPHSASVRAKTKVQLLRVAREDFEQLVDGHCAAAYKLAYNAIGGLAERLRRATDRLADLATADIKAEAGSAEMAKKPSEWSSFRAKMFDSWNL